MNAQDYYNRGNAYYNKGNYDQAISDHNKAIEINPKYAKAYYNRGATYGKKDDKKKVMLKKHFKENVKFISI